MLGNNGALPVRHLDGVELTNGGGLALEGYVLPPEMGLRSAYIRIHAMSENYTRYPLTQGTILFILPLRSFLVVA